MIDDDSDEANAPAVQRYINSMLQSNIKRLTEDVKDVQEILEEMDERFCRLEDKLEKLHQSMCWKQDIQG